MSNDAIWALPAPTKQDLAPSTAKKTPKRSRRRKPTKEDLSAQLEAANAELEKHRTPPASRGQVLLAVWLPVFAAGLACLAGDLQAQSDTPWVWGVGAEALCAVVLAVNIPHVTSGAAHVMRCSTRSALAIAIASDLGAMFAIAAIYHVHPATWAGVIVAYGFTAVMVGVSAYLNVVGFTKG